MSSSCRTTNYFTRKITVAPLIWQNNSDFHAPKNIVVGKIHINFGLNSKQVIKNILFFMVRWVKFWKIGQNQKKFSGKCYKGRLCVDVHSIKFKNYAWNFFSTKTWNTGKIFLFLSSFLNKKLSSKWNKKKSLLNSVKYKFNKEMKKCWNYFVI